MISRMVVVDMVISRVMVVDMVVEHQFANTLSFLPLRTLLLSLQHLCLFNWQEILKNGKMIKSVVYS